MPIEKRTGRAKSELTGVVFPLSLLYQSLKAIRCSEITRQWRGLAVVNVT